MPRRRPATTLARQSAELALAVPQVVGHRLARMALAGPNLSARDRREFSGMVHEKTVAFGSAWHAMGWQLWRAQQAMALSLLQAAWAPWLGASRGGVARQWQDAANQVLAAGLAPVHRQAVSNARRLARTRLR